MRFSRGALASIRLSLVESDIRHEMRISGREGGASVIEQGPLRIESPAGRREELPMPDDLPASTELQIPDTDWRGTSCGTLRALVDPLRAVMPLPRRRRPSTTVIRISA
ncbi:MAG: hypothetical protein R3E12_19980 [Candidatus Eisenbacteria bacterium]